MSAALRRRESQIFQHTVLEERNGFLTGTMPRDPLIGLVGKPSSGKSTTLNRYVDCKS